MSAIDELKGKTVLIVDDDAELAETIKEQLEDIGMIVVGSAGDAKSALRLVAETDPALLVLDIKLPDMDGIELAGIINATEPRPILLLSAYSDSEYIRRARKSGVITYLVKPVTIENMVPSIVLAMDRFREMASLKATVDDMKENISNVEMIDEARKTLSRTMGVPEREAYEEIRNRSRRENRPIAEIAKSIVAHHG